MKNNIFMPKIFIKNENKKNYFLFFFFLIILSVFFIGVSLFVFYVFSFYFNFLFFFLWDLPFFIFWVKKKNKFLESSIFFREIFKYLDFDVKNVNYLIVEFECGHFENFFRLMSFVFDSASEPS